MNKTVIMLYYFGRGIYRKNCGYVGKEDNARLKSGMGVTWNNY